MIFYLTNVTLDIIWGTTWWIVKKTTGGIYYLVYGRSREDPHKKYIRLNTIELEKNKDILDSVSNEIALQKEEIRRLSDNIIVLTDYIKKIEKDKQVLE
jgi:hypothetical protein